MHKRTIAIISNRDLNKAPRIHREVEALADEYDVILFGESVSRIPNSTYKNIYDQRTFFDKVLNYICRKFSSHAQIRFSRLKKTLEINNISCVIIHEPSFLPLISNLKKKGFKTVFNAHEYHPLEFQNTDNWSKSEENRQQILYRKNLKNLDLLINVSNGISQKCQDIFGKESIIIPNAANFVELPIKLSNSARIKLVHHGVLLPSRKLDFFIQCLKGFEEKFQLDIYGVPSKSHSEYYNILKNLIKDYKHIRLLPPVPFIDIIPTMSNYDLGVVVYPPLNFNHTHCLPNKYFEYIQARIGILTCSSKEMKQLNSKYCIGLDITEFNKEKITESLSMITQEKINLFKKNTFNAAKKENAEYYQDIFLKAINELYLK
tara:strand:+ start:2131 stop:3258 length:1128 start_codon:yes stop_codon:yes gene_type:complete